MVNCVRRLQSSDTTRHACHASAKTAFDMLERVNTSFEKRFPIVELKAVNTLAESATAEAANEVLIA